jgi:RNAse (barnase) inhibitor barstar
MLQQTDSANLRGCRPSIADLYVTFYPMAHTLVNIDCRQIRDWDSFHSIFAHAFGFPAFYGRNMNAWIDCMTSIDSPEDSMSKIHAPKDGFLVLQLKHAGHLKSQAPEIYEAILESSAFVNWRRIESGDSPIISLSFHDKET